MSTPKRGRPASIRSASATSSLTGTAPASISFARMASRSLPGTYTSYPGTPSASSRTIVSDSTVRLSYWLVRSATDTPVACWIMRAADGPCTPRTAISLASFACTSSEKISVVESLGKRRRHMAIDAQQQPAARLDDAHIGNHPALRSEVCRIHASPFRQARDVVGEQRVQKRRAIGAGQRDGTL